MKSKIITTTKGVRKVIMKIITRMITQRWIGFKNLSYTILRETKLDQTKIIYQVKMIIEIPKINQIIIEHQEKDRIHQAKR